MLQSLSDLFLVISNDTKKITNKDLSILYNFIIKKIPQIEQLYPSLVSKSLNYSSSSIKSIEDKNQINVNDLKSNKDSKKIIVQFQKKAMSLFNDFIDYCYNEGIIKLNNKFEKVIKGKIDDKLKEKNNIKNLSNNLRYNYNYNNLYQKELLLKKTRKEEIRNFLIFLIINGDINFNIYPNHYVNFFNSENRSKNRLTAEQFMKFIKLTIKIYKDIKKNSNKRITTKSNNNTDKKINNTERKKSNAIEEKTNKTDGKKNSKGIKSYNTDNKPYDLKIKDRNLIDVQIYKTDGKSDKNRFSSNRNKKSRVNFTHNENFIKNSFKEYKKKTDNSIIINYDNDSNGDEINDTIRCETPKNIHKDSKMESKDKIDISNLYLNSEQNQRRFSVDKKNNRNNSKLTISTIPSKDENIINSNSSKKPESEKYKKKNLSNRNKNNISPGENFPKYHQSLLDENYLINIKEKNFIEDTQPINKSQSIIGKEYNNDNINDKKMKYNESEYKKKEKEKKHDTIFNDKYNLVSKIKKDKNNNQFKEMYLYKNLEVHQHLVIFHDDKENEENNENEEDDIGCIIN